MADGDQADGQAINSEGVDKNSIGGEQMTKYTDKKFASIEALTNMIKTENKRQIYKWGTQTHTLFEWLAFTTEELGSLSKAISEFEYRHGDVNRVVAEAIQVATLSLKIAEMVRGE